MTNISRMKDIVEEVKMINNKIKKLTDLYNSINAEGGKLKGSDLAKLLHKITELGKAKKNLLDEFNSLKGVA